MNFKSYCLTLPESHSMRNRAKLEFERAGLDVKFWNGINGLEFGLKTFLPEHHDWFSGPKIIGIYLSHWILWRVLEAVDAEVFLIFEDDVVLHPDFEKLWPVFCDELPKDWQWAYVGACCVRTSGYKKISDHMAIANAPMATHAYMFKKEILCQMIERVACVRRPLDQDIAKSLLPKIRHYAFIPSLASQFESNCFSAKDWIF